MLEEITIGRNLFQLEAIDFAFGTVEKQMYFIYQNKVRVRGFCTEESFNFEDKLKYYKLI